MLTDHHVVILDAAETVTVSFARVAFTSGGGPRRRRHLHYKSVAGVIPGEEALRVAPWRATFLGASFDRRIVIKLIIPNQVVERAVVDLTKRRPDRISIGITSTAASLF